MNDEHNLSATLMLRSLRLAINSVFVTLRPRHISNKASTKKQRNFTRMFSRGPMRRNMGVSQVKY